MLNFMIQFFPGPYLRRKGVFNVAGQLDSFAESHYEEYPPKTKTPNSMAHRLEPLTGREYLPCMEAIVRIREEFDDVDFDQDQGSDDVGDIIAKLIELKAPQQIIDHAMAGRDDSYHVTISDGPSDGDCSISFILQPNTGPLIGYHSRQHEEQSRPLLERCAKALGYQIILL